MAWISPPPAGRTLGPVDMEELRVAVNTWLAADGPMEAAELADRAVAAGLLSEEPDEDGFGPDDAVADLISRYDDWWTIHDGSEDERVVLASTFTETGMTFTHRVTEAEVESQALDFSPDLSVIGWGTLDGLPLNDGGGLVVHDFVGPGVSKLAGPLGWIDRVKSGDLLAFRRTDGILSVDIVDEDELGDGRAELEALRETIGHWIPHGHGNDEIPVVVEALARDPSLFQR